MSWEKLYASRMSQIAPSDIRERMKLLGDRRLIQLGVGLPDPAVVPYPQIAQAAADIFADPDLARASMQYGPSEGYEPLRAWLVDYMGTLGVPCEPENIMLVGGSQQGFDFIGKLLISPGDPVMVEAPSFIGALRAFDGYEPAYRLLPPDASAWDVATVGPAKFCYASPEFRNPTGTCLTLDERHRLVDLATTAGMLLVEDGCYEKLRYDGETLPSLQSLDVARSGGIENSRVLYTNTFSKTISPSLRVGWVAGPSELIRKLVLIKQGGDLVSSTLNQMIALRVAANYLTESVEAGRRLYRARRDTMLAALTAHMPADVTFTRPDGGLYVWLELPPSIDGDEFAIRALEKHGVSTISGTSFYPVEPRRNTLRLSFSLASDAEIEEGVRILAALVGEMRDARHAGR
jgi:DNA-binding transcriptional MocR family regulator